MSLMDLLFPQVAAATHLRSIRDQNAQAGDLKRLRGIRQTATLEALKTRIDSLEDDLGYLTLVLSGLLSTLDEKGVIRSDDVKKELKELDGIDGVSDGKINIQVLKYLIEQASK